LANRKLTLFILVLFLSGIYIFVFSENGFLERINFNEHKVKVLNRISEQRKVNTQLKNDLIRSSQEGSSKVLKSSGFIKKGDSILVVKNKGSLKRKIENKKELAEGFTIKLLYIRIIWIIISLLVLFLFLSAGKKNHGYN